MSTLQCEYFGICGSCNLGDRTYDEQLNLKIDREKERFHNLWDKDFDIIKSSDGAFRNRAEFRIWKIYNEDDSFSLHYAMNDIDKNVLPIEKCPIVSPSIANIMPILIAKLSEDHRLNDKLFSIEFLSSTTNDMLVTLIYHRKLDESWKKLSSELESEFNIKVIGRSRKQKIITSDDFIEEELNIFDSKIKFQYKEGGFTQPNQKVNEKMIMWVLTHLKEGGDLCELYCGGGNFTIPLSMKFDKVLATEISKTSIKSAKLNCELNNTTNIEFIRMSSEEFVEARNKVRTFTRLKDIDLDSYKFSTIFLDPPRAGLDATTTTLAQNFDQIIYISCNPETLNRDLEVLTQTHTINNFALFDQFAYSKHIESGVILTRKSAK